MDKCLFCGNWLSDVVADMCDLCFEFPPMGVWVSPAHAKEVMDDGSEDRVR